MSDKGAKYIGGGIAAGCAVAAAAACVIYGHATVAVWFVVFAVMAYP